MIYLISYKPQPFAFSLDLFSSADAVSRTLEAYPGWCKCFDTAWLIATTEDITTVSTKLSNVFGKKDIWVIAAVSEQICGSLSTEAWDWLKETRGNGF